MDSHYELLYEGLDEESCRLNSAKEVSSPLVASAENGAKLLPNILESSANGGCIAQGHVNKPARLVFLCGETDLSVDVPHKSV